MNHVLLGRIFLLSIIAFKADATDLNLTTDLVVPTKITADPPDSFKRGSELTLKAKFAANKVPPVGGFCKEPAFVARIYDAKLVKDELPRASRDTTHIPFKQVTPYIQQSSAPLEPLPTLSALAIERTFEPLVMPRRTRVPRLFIGLFRSCRFVRPVDINQATGTLINNEEFSGSYIGGTSFRLDCGTSSKVTQFCVYRPE